MTDTPQPPFDTPGIWSKHRVEALTDGIFAVAMTLLVIELKVPDPGSILDEAQLTHALIELVPKTVSWLLSFFVLAIFWVAHHRLFHYVRFVDSGLLWRNLFQLAFVSLMPFSAALIGEFGIAPVAQMVYNGNMILLGAVGIMKLRYVRGHPALASHAMQDATYHATLLRLGCLIVAGLSAIVIAETRATGFATLTYLAMIPVGFIGRRLESRRRTGRGEGRPPESPPNHHP